MAQSMAKWEHPKTFEVPNPQSQSNGWIGWVAPQSTKPTWANDGALKKQFGIELAKGHPSPFLAACKLFPDGNGDALWASINWINDAEVAVARDLYLKTAEVDVTLLDKHQLSAKLLRFADERLPNGYPAIEPDIRLKSLELYAKIQGYLKPDNNNSGNFVHNEMKIVIVKPDTTSNKVVDVEPTVIDDYEIQPLQLKIAAV